MCCDSCWPSSQKLSCERKAADRPRSPVHFADRVLAAFTTRLRRDYWEAAEGAANLEDITLEAVEAVANLEPEGPPVEGNSFGKELLRRAWMLICTCLKNRSTLWAMLFKNGFPARRSRCRLHWRKPALFSPQVPHN